VNERWFVYSCDNNLEIFVTEEAAKETFDKYLEDFRDEAAGEEWSDEVEHLAWGKVNQTVKLKEIPHEFEKEDKDDEDPYPNGLWDAFVVDHEKKE
jgi:hypothetical protein